MSRVWQVLAIVGAILFIIIVVGMVKKSTNVRETVIERSEKQLYSGSEVEFTTNKGNFTVTLYRDKTPKTTDNFAKLAAEGFYDGQRFHRVIKDFMIQGGDPLSKDPSKRNVWGTGGPGYSFADEFVNGLSNKVGTIAMANSGPNTNGSQFFINVAQNTYLDGKHTVFGEVTRGMDVVMAISQVVTAPNAQPTDDIIIEKATLK